MISITMAFLASAPGAYRKIPNGRFLKVTIWYLAVCTRSRCQECHGDGNHSKIEVPWRSARPGFCCRCEKWMDSQEHQW